MATSVERSLVSSRFVLEAELLKNAARWLIEKINVAYSPTQVDMDLIDLVF